MCIVCGNVAEAQTASTSMVTLLVALSPLWGIYAYRALHWFSLETHASRRWSITRLGILTAVYALLAYLLLTVVMIGVFVYGFDWRALYAFGVIYMTLIYFFLARSLTKALPMKKRGILLVGFIHGVLYFLVSIAFLFFVELVDHNPEFTFWFIGFGWLFTSQLSVIAPTLMVCMLIFYRMRAHHKSTL